MSWFSLSVLQPRMYRYLYTMRLPEGDVTVFILRMYCMWHKAAEVFTGACDADLPLCST